MGEFMKFSSLEDCRNHVSAMLKKHLAGLEKKKGGVFYSSWSSLLKPNGYYIMGLNPGGEPDQSKTPSIIESIFDDRLNAPWSAFTDECWEWGGRCLEPGGHRNQVRVKQIADHFEIDLSSTVSTNAVFVQTPRAVDIDVEWIGQCWSVHEELMSWLRPRVVIALGNGASLSPFSTIAARAEIVEGPRLLGRSFRQGKTMKCHLSQHCGDLVTTVIGFPHPSRFSPAGTLRCLDAQGQ